MKLFDRFNEKEIVIHDYESGLLYEKGMFKEILEKGVYKVSRKGFEKEISVINKRMKLTVIPHLFIRMSR